MYDEIEAMAFEGPYINYIGSMVSEKLSDIMPLDGNQFKRLAEADQLEDFMTRRT